MSLKVLDVVIGLKYECCVVIFLAEWRTGKHGIELERIAEAVMWHYSTDGYATFRPRYSRCDWS